MSRLATPWRRPWPPRKGSCPTPELAGPAGLLLTGGASRRLGTDKARLVLGGRTLAALAAQRLVAVCAPVIEVGPGTSGLPACRESPAGGGPLAALAAGLEELRARGSEGPVLVLAVDLPVVSEPLLRLILSSGGPEEAVAPVAGGRLQPLCARYPAQALEAAQGLLTAGERSMQALLRELPLLRLEPAVWQRVAPPNSFWDVDTPEDAAALGELL